MIICRIRPFNILVVLALLAALLPSSAQALSTTAPAAPAPTTNPNFRKVGKISPPSPSDVKPPPTPAARAPTPNPNLGRGGNFPPRRRGDVNPPPTSQPVPLLSAEDEVNTMHLQPGFHMEVVACEPMVQHPVQISWDPDGRLY